MSHKTESAVFICRLLATTGRIDLESVLRSVRADVRIVRDTAGKPWLCCKDICRTLNIAWSGSTLAGLPADGRRRIPTPTASGTQSLVYVDSSIFLCLIFRSEKPTARAIAEALRNCLPKASYTTINHLSGEKTYEHYAQHITQ